MQLTEIEIKELRSFKENADNDNIRFKETIKKKLLDNRKIIHVLNNKELEDSNATADEYYGINILPYYMIEPTQTNVQNFICYEVQFDEVDRYNSIIKYGQIVFTILCEEKNIQDKDTYFARHDLLAAQILQEFNWTNYFGMQIHCISDEPSVVDSSYACRTLIFEMEMPNSISKTKQRVSKIINYETHI